MKILNEAKEITSLVIDSLIVEEIYCENNGDFLFGVYNLVGLKIVSLSEFETKKIYFNCLNQSLLSKLDIKNAGIIMSQELFIPQALIDEIKSGKATLFLGAGASREADFPDSAKIVEYLTKEAGEPYFTQFKDRKLDEVANYLNNEPGYGYEWVKRKLIELFNSYQKIVKRPPSRAHGLITAFKWSTIFTTNYDRLIEISYDTNPDCTQRILTIYKPDLQIIRKSPDTVRLIKINGSIDEAERNSQHKLVLTFADQKDALSYNKDFYDVLKSEAINGPIVFIGFSFTFPGTQQKGSSPEFEVLERIIREMGPLNAKWHFCVTPYDGNSIDAKLNIRTLESNHIKVINASFGQFMDSLSKQFSGKPLALEKRPPIVIPIGTTNIEISAEQYSRDKETLEFVGPHLVTGQPPLISKSLNGYETWSSIFSGHFIQRTCKIDFLKYFSKTQTPGSILAIVAPPGWGKTIFLKDIAVSLSKKQPIIWLNPYSTIESQNGSEKPILISSWDTLRIDALVGAINEKSRKAHLHDKEILPVIICDNCPERVEEALALWRFMTSANRSFLLLLSFRDSEYAALSEVNPLLKRCIVFRPDKNNDTKEETRRLVDFCADNQVGLIGDISQREVITTRILKSEADTALIFALQVIFDKQHRPFNEIVRGLWQKITNNYEKQLLIRTASLHRFSSRFYPRFYSLLNTFPPHQQIEVISAYRMLKDNGLLFEEDLNDEPCVRTQHSLIAEKLVEVSGYNNCQIDDELIAVLKPMSNNNSRDLDIIRELLKRINDYSVRLSNENKGNELFTNAVKTTNYDWVVCQQYSKYLLENGRYESSFSWANRAMEQNRGSTSLQHQKGNILFKWARALKEAGENEKANEKIEEAKKHFAKSRMASVPNEYGFVTHLDMLIYLIEHSSDDIEKANLFAEGTRLYTEGIEVIPEYAFNFFLKERYKIFDLKGNAVTQLCEKISQGIKSCQCSVHGIAFLAENMYNEGKYQDSIDLLNSQEVKRNETVLLYVKEAEFHAREGNFSRASVCLNSAKSREKYVENEEVLWRMVYWDLIVQFVLEDYRKARIAAGRLADINYKPRQQIPQGYIWRQIAKAVSPEQRSFTKHAKLWTGRIQSLQTKGQYGRIELSNALGDTFNIDFIPRYFARRNLHMHEPVKFAVSILPFGLRAVSEDQRPFENTIDDVFMK